MQVDYLITASRLVTLTILFDAVSGGSPVTGILPAAVTATFTKPGTAPTTLTVDGSNFRELGSSGTYEYDLAAANLDIQGIYKIVFSGGAFDTVVVLLNVPGALESQLEKVLGFGVVVLTETFGGTGGDPKPLQIISGGQPLDFVRFYLFLESDWDAGNRDIATYSKGIGESDQSGDWTWPIVVQPEDYILLADTSANTLFELTEIKRFTVAVPTVAPQPTITLVTPNTGPAAGGTLIVINGTDFVDGATVDIGGNAATSVSFISDGEVRAVTPSGSVGAEDVILVNPDAQFATDIGGFTYT